MSAPATAIELPRKRQRPPRASVPDQPAPAPAAAVGPAETELLLAWFRLRARIRGAWLQTLWSQEGMSDGRAAVTHAELAGILADQDAPAAQAAWEESQDQVRAWKSELADAERALASWPDSRLGCLARIFGLDREELGLLQLSTAVALDPALGRVCAYLQDHSGRPYLTEELAARLLGSGRAGAWTPDLNVFRWELVVRREAGPAEPLALLCDPQIADFLRGGNALAQALAASAKLVPPRDRPLPDWPVADAARIADGMLRRPARLRLLVAGPPGAGKNQFAAAVARQLQLPLLVIDADSVADDAWPRFFLHAQRQAFLDRVALAWTGDAPRRRSWPSVHAWFPLQFILCGPADELPAAAGAIDVRVALSVPEPATREQLWREHVPETANWPAAEVRALAERHSVWPGDIERAGRLGARTASAASTLIREAARSRFDNLAQILECPFRPDDMVLPAGVRQTLDAIAFEAEERGPFWQQAEARRLFPQGRGLIALFSGPPGTGKTMAAQVIAARLGQDLCRVNVAQLVSKWVGETSKNCEQVIRIAADNNAILFFDEADALFSRRTAEIRDAQDKFANTDTAFLLQAIENYPGVAFLASNLKSNIDAAFVRRLRYVVEFPKPDAALQRVLWTKFVGALSGEDRARALAPALEALSAAVDATGAQIKFAVLGGLFAARADRQPLGVRHLLTGLERELGKDGRGLGPRERERILKLEPAE